MCSAPQRGTTQNFWVLFFCHDRLDSIWRRNPFRMGSAPSRGTTQNFWVLLFCHDKLDSIWGAEPIQNGFRPSEGHNPEFGNIYAFFWQNVAIYALFRKISPFMQFFGKMSRFTHFFLGSAQTVKITLSSAFKFLSALCGSPNEVLPEDGINIGAIGVLPARIPLPLPGFCVSQFTNKNKL